MVRNLIRLRPYLRPNRWLVLGAFIAALGSAVFEGIGIGLLIPMLALLQGDPATVLREKLSGSGRFAWLGEHLPDLSPNGYIWMFGGLIFGAILAKNAVFLGYQRLQAAFGRRIAVNLREAFFDVLQSASLHIFEERKAGDLANVYFGEVYRTQMAVEFTLLLCQRIFVLGLYVVVLLLISWQFAIALLGFGLVLAVAGTSLQTRLTRGGLARVDVQKRLAEFVIQILAGIRVVRATHAQKMVQREFRDLNRRLADLDRGSAFLMQAMVPMTEVVAVGGTMLLIGIAYATLIQSGRLEAGGLIVTGAVVVRMLPQLSQIYSVAGQVAFFGSGTSTVVEWFACPRFPARPFGDREFTGIRHEIRFEQVAFAYPNGTEALRHIDLVIPAGRMVAVVGASGSGKTTLASLLLRLREPSAGRILVDGTDYHEFTAESWHRRIGMVEQEAFLFNETIARNIAFGLPDVTPDQLARALETAHLKEVVRDLPRGLDTVVGERGMTLSGGQRQRLAIARAVVREPDLLILDEATSALDNVSERQVQAALDRARHGRTSLVIAHRLSTIRNADLVVVLDGGRIAQVGGWEELERADGPFRRLLAAASGGHLADAPDPSVA